MGIIRLLPFGPTRAVTDAGRLCAGSGFRFRTLLHPQSFASVVLGRAEDSTDTRFDESRIGLHHLGYHVPDVADLDEWAAHLDGLGIEHSGITASNHEAGAQIWLRDPDHIWLEIYWANRNFFADRLRQRWREARRSGDRTAWVTGAPAPATTRIG